MVAWLFGKLRTARLLHGMKGAEPLQLTKQPVVSAASQRWRTRTSNGSGRSVGRWLSVVGGGGRWSVVGAVGR
jgi:hypothetical protein